MNSDFHLTPRGKFLHRAIVFYFAIYTVAIGIFVLLAAMISEYSSSPTLTVFFPLIVSIVLVIFAYEKFYYKIVYQFESLEQVSPSFSQIKGLTETLVILKETLYKMNEMQARYYIDLPEILTEKDRLKTEIDQLEKKLGEALREIREHTE